MIMISITILITIAVKFKASLINKLAWAGLALSHGAKIYMGVPIYSPSTRERKAPAGLHDHRSDDHHRCDEVQACFIDELSRPDLASRHGAKVYGIAIHFPLRVAETEKSAA